MEKGLQCCRQQVDVLGLTFPYDERTPAQSGHCGLARRVSLAIATELRQPIIETTFGQFRQLAAWMLMPKTSVDPDKLLQARKNEIGRARKIAAIKAKAETQSMAEPPNHKLGFGVALADARHQRAAGRIDHASKVVRISINARWFSVGETGFITSQIKDLLRLRRHDHRRE